MRGAARGRQQVLFRPEGVRIADGADVRFEVRCPPRSFPGDHPRRMVDTGGEQPVVVETAERRTFRQGEPIGLAVNPDALLTLER